MYELYVCMYVCMYICMYVCTAYTYCMFLYICTYVCVYVLYLCMYAFIYIFIQLFVSFREGSKMQTFILQSVRRLGCDGGLVLSFVFPKLSEAKRTGPSHSEQKRV